MKAYEQERGYQPPTEKLWVPDPVGASLEQQLSSDRGEGFWIKNRDLDVLDGAFRQVVAESDIDNKQIIYDTIPIMRGLHANDKRKGGHNYGVHPYGTAAHVAQVPEVTAVAVVTALLHDGEEMHPNTVDAAVTKLHTEFGHSVQDVRTIRHGVHILNDKRHKRSEQISQTDYYKSIDTLAEEYVDLRHAWAIKISDRNNNYDNDLSYALEPEHRGTQDAAHKIRHYRPKMLTLSGHVNRHGIEPALQPQLAARINLGNKLVDEFEYPHRN